MSNYDLIDPVKNTPAVTAKPGLSLPTGMSPAVRRRLLGLAVLTVCLVLGFIRPLYLLLQRSLHSDLYSHILLIPCITAYLIWGQRDRLGLDAAPAKGLAVWPALAGLGLLAAYGWGIRAGWQPVQDDHLALMTLSFLLLLLGGGFLLFAPATLRVAAFPLAFLIFMVPFPEFVNRGIESFFQHASADAAWLLLKLSGLPVFRQGTSFQLPGFSFEVAPECSGIRSSLVLFITSLLAGYLFLRSPVRRAVLTGIVIPLAILRNGLRVFTIGQLCVHVSPEMINSPIHHRGGPIFFVLSLIPFFLVLYFLRRSEAKAARRRTTSLNHSPKNSP